MRLDNPFNRYSFQWQKRLNERDPVHGFCAQGVKIPQSISTRRAIFIPGSSAELAGSTDVDSNDARVIVKATFASPSHNFRASADGDAEKRARN